MNLELTGAGLIAGRPVSAGPATITSIDPRTGQPNEPRVHVTTAREVADACSLAAEAAPLLAALSRSERAEILRRIATALDEQAGDIVGLADAETALGARPRLEGELARTTGQLRFLGDVVEEGSYLEAIIDHPTDEGTPLLKRQLVPIGPVAVFGASNFPLAFSVAGGDTAAALATGCPVVVKAHPSHPLTSELVGRIVASALSECRAPSGAFSVVHGFDAGTQLVKDSHIQAVAFTGSHAGGMALWRLANERDAPIPVYAEMGSLNPVVVTPRAAASEQSSIAEGFVSSFTLGIGQFCTKPGLLFVPSGAEGLRRAIRDQLPSVGEQPLLNRDIHEAWVNRISHWRSLDGARRVHPPDGWTPAEDRAGAVLFEVDAAEFVETDELRNECFGPTALVVTYDSIDSLQRALGTLAGNLTGAIFGSGADDSEAAAAMDALAPKVGRLIWNGWPTGVAVTWAMNHGGPFPATSNPLHTSVGATSLRRFVRPLAFQGVPEGLLPHDLRDDQPDPPPRRVDGVLQLPT